MFWRNAMFYSDFRDDYIAEWSTFKKKYTIQNSSL